MSGTELVSSIAGNFLCCVICTEKYDKPRVLPCQHSFCENCLESYIVVNEFWDTLPCPTCREHANVPRQGASGFPMNHYIVGLADCVGSYTSQADDTEYLCDNCFDLGERNTPIVYCSVCGHSLCDICQKAHQRLRATRSHLTTSFLGSINKNATIADSAKGSQKTNEVASSQSETITIGSVQSSHSSSGVKNTHIETTSTTYRNSNEVMGLSDNGVGNTQPENITTTAVQSSQLSPGAINNCGRTPSTTIASSSCSSHTVQGAQSTWYVPLKPRVTQAELKETIRVCSGDSDIWDISLDTDGDIYIVDIEGERVRKYNVDERSEKNFATSGRNRVRNPYHVACTTDGKVAILQSDDSVKVFSKAQTFVNKFGKFLDSHGLAINSRNEIVTVEQGKCHIYEQEGSVVRSFSLRPLPEWCGAYIATDNQNNVIISFSLLHMVQAFTENGQLLWSYGSEGSGIGQLKNPRGVCVDRYDNILVADSGNHRVTMLSATGQFQRNLIRCSDDTFFPSGITVDRSDHLLVASRYQGRILVYDYLSFDELPGSNAAT